MLTSVRVFNLDRTGSIWLELPLIPDPYSPLPYLIKRIDGLGPPKADILTSKYVTLPGAQYQGSRGQSRNIVLTLGSLFTTSGPFGITNDIYGDMRRWLYRYMLPGNNVEMQFLSDNFETVSIRGYVESFEPVIFSEEPEVQISILCPDPYFTALTPVLVSRTGTGNFTSVNNRGHVPTGCMVTVTNFQSQEATPILIRRVSPTISTNRETSFKGPIYMQGSNMNVQIDTTRGQKRAVLATAGSYTNPDVLTGSDALGSISGWVELHPSLNSVKVTLDATNTSLETSAQIYLAFTPKFVGL